MAQKKVRRALSAISTYVDLTVAQPVSTLYQLKQKSGRVAAKKIQRVSESGRFLGGALHRRKTSPHRAGMVSSRWSASVLPEAENI